MFSVAFVSPPVVNFYCGFCSHVWQVGLLHIAGVGPRGNGDRMRWVMPEGDGIFNPVFVFSFFWVVVWILVVLDV